jgi:hypothetical protein
MASAVVAAIEHLHPALEIDPRLSSRCHRSNLQSGAVLELFSFCRQAVIRMGCQSLTQSQGDKVKGDKAKSTQQHATSDTLIDDSRPHCMKKEEDHESEHPERNIR